jgi:hypothetical protein
MNTYISTGTPQFLVNARARFFSLFSLSLFLSLSLTHSLSHRLTFSLSLSEAEHARGDESADKGRCIVPVAAARTAT